MKVEFWKEGLCAIILCLIAPLMCLTFAIITALGLLGAEIKLVSIFWICWLALLVLEYFKIGLFHTVVLTDTGIELKFGKKQIAYIEWFEITDFEIKLKYRGGRRLKFASRDKCIEVVLSSQKLYDTIMEICPNLNVTMPMKDSPYLTLHYKRWLKKQQNDK